MATITGGLKINGTNIGHHLHQTRSLERILEEAHLSGELKLSGRKLKDFPKCAGKYNLNDTVIADLSRNRFCELPEDVTSFSFLETLLVYHNALRSIPESIRGLYSLSYLDLRSNQLSTLPREICILPIQVLLLSNNRLTALPDELGRMKHLTELDAACNQITHLPPRISDLKNLKSLSLRSNQLVYLPREIKYLNLVMLDISCNRIATLPVELRLITTLVNLELGNNPLTSPPASLCVRGLVHVFKYLETMAAKGDKSKIDGHTTLRRTITPKQQTMNNIEIDKNKKYSSDWYDLPAEYNYQLNQNNSTPPPPPPHPPPPQQSSTSSSLSPCRSPISKDNNHGTDTDSRSNTPTNQQQRAPMMTHEKHGNTSSSNDSSPESDYHLDGGKIDEKFKALGTVQTYREYKEALRQQRNQDSSAIYRPKEHASNGNGTPPPYSSNRSPTIMNNQNNQCSPTFQPNKTDNSDTATPSPPSTVSNHQNGQGTTTTIGHHHDDMGKIEEIVITRKPIQKVTPSRNTNVLYSNKNSSNTLNGNSERTTAAATTTTSDVYDAYVKPKSPTHSSHSAGVYSDSSKITSSHKAATTPKPNRSVSWNREISTDKSSFTMRREFDKQKEETELIEQLRKIIESRLKMSLPTDISLALCDGVVLCHLANHVRPRSVGSIHVPSPAVPKLTMAKCRRNVDNFLNACRSIGIDEELICSSGDILPSDDSMETSFMPNILALYWTVVALHDLALIKNNNSNNNNKNNSNNKQAKNAATNTKTATEEFSNNRLPSNSTTASDATNNHNHNNNTNNNNNNNNNHKYFDEEPIIFYDNIDNNDCKVDDNDDDDDDVVIKDDYQHEFNGNYNLEYDLNVTFDYGKTNPPKTLDLFKNNLTKSKRKIAQNRYEHFGLNGITEEENEYDISIMDKMDLNTNGDGIDTIDSIPNAVNPNQSNESNEKSNLNVKKIDKTTEKKNEEFLKRIEYFEYGSCCQQSQQCAVDVINVINPTNETNENHNLSTILCLGTFLLTLFFVLIFEIPS